MMMRSKRVSASRRRSRTIYGGQLPIVTTYRRSFAVIDAIERYWNARIHDLEMTDRPVGSLEFFDDLDDYRFDKLHYLPQLVDFDGFRGKTLLEVGCGIGTDLVRFARGGAIVSGIDLSETAIELARRNFHLHGLTPYELRTANAEALALPRRLVRRRVWARRHPVHIGPGAPGP